MTFAAPLLAGIAAAIAIPSLVILYFLKLRRRTVDVSTTLLWKKSIQDLQANAPFQKLRKNILLLLQLLALIAGLFALAQPRIETEAEVPSRRVIMIDRSASMAALDGDEEFATTRLGTAKEAAIGIVEGLREPGMGGAFGLGGSASEEAMVIAFDAGEARVIQTFTSDKRLLIDAIGSIEQSDAPSGIEEAFRLAQAHRPRETRTDNAGGTQEAEVIELEGVVGGPPQQFDLFTDGRIPDLATFNPAANDGVTYHRVGREAVGNVGITGLRAERAYDEPSNLSVFASLSNTNAEPVTVDVELLLDGSPIGLRAVTVPGAAVPEGAVEAVAEEEAAAGEDGEAETVRRRTRATPGTGGVVFELERSEGAVAQVRIARDQLPVARNALQTDDLGVLIIPRARRTSVAMFTDGSPFLERAIRSLPLSRFDVFPTGELDSVLADVERAAQYDVFVLVGVLPAGSGADGETGAGLPPGRWLVFDAVPGGPDGLIETGAAERAAFLDWERQHPSLRGLSLDSVLVAEMRVTAVPEAGSADVIAMTTEGPGIVELAAGDVRAIVVPFNVVNTTWPWYWSLLGFTSQAIDALGAEAGVTGGGDRGRLELGGVLADRLPIGAEGVTVRPPTRSGDTTASGPRVELIPAPDGRVTFGPVRTTGVYEVSWSGEATAGDVRDGGIVRRFYAANLLDQGESDVAPAPAVELGDQIVAASGVDTATDIRDFWKWLLAGALAVIMFEWWVFNKKVYL